MLWFLDLNWPWPVFVVALIIAIVAILKLRSWGVLATALVLYLGIHWNMWTWVSLVFCLAVGIGLLAAAWCAYRFHNVVARVARAASLVAVAIPLVMLVLRIGGATRNAHSIYAWLLAAFIAITLVLLMLLLLLDFEKVVAFLAVAALAASIAIGVIWAISSHDTKANAGTQGNLTAQQATAQDALFVDPAKVPSDYCNGLVTKTVTVKVNGKDQTTPVFDAGVTHDVGAGGKISSDATNVPLAPQTIKGEQAVICQDPAQAAMVMNRLGAVTIGDKTIGKVNEKWIKAQGDLTVIKSWSQGCLTTDVTTHLECAKAMSYTAALLAKFNEKGVTQVAQTSWNVYLPNGAVVGEIPEFGLNPVQEVKGYFVEFDYTSKTGDLCYQYGFNVGTAASGANGGDQRLVGIPCETPKPAATPTPTPSSSPPAGCTSNCGSGCTSNCSPGCKSNCTSTPSCVQPASPGPGYTWHPELCKWVCGCNSKASASQSKSPAPAGTYPNTPTKAPVTTEPGTIPTSSAPGTPGAGPTGTSQGTGRNSTPVPTAGTSEAPVLH